jgi:hypothetical protein
MTRTYCRSDRSVPFDDRTPTVVGGIGDRLWRLEQRPLLFSGSRTRPAQEQCALSAGWGPRHNHAIRVWYSSPSPCSGCSNELQVTSTRIRPWPGGIPSLSLGWRRPPVRPGQGVEVSDPAPSVPRTFYYTRQRAPHGVGKGAEDDHWPGRQPGDGRPPSVVARAVRVPTSLSMTTTLPALVRRIDGSAGILRMSRPAELENLVRGATNEHILTGGAPLHPRAQMPIAATACVDFTLHGWWSPRRRFTARPMTPLPRVPWAWNTRLPTRAGSRVPRSCSRKVSSIVVQDLAWRKSAVGNDRHDPLNSWTGSLMSRRR